MCASCLSAIEKPRGHTSETRVKGSKDIVSVQTRLVRVDYLRDRHTDTSKGKEVLIHDFRLEKLTDNFYLLLTLYIGIF